MNVFVGVGAFVIGLGEISSFSLLTVYIHFTNYKRTYKTLLSLFDYDSSPALYLREEFDQFACHFILFFVTGYDV